MTIEDEINEYKKMEVDQKVELQRLKDQIERLVADAESEKDTRSRATNRIYEEFKQIDITFRGIQGNNGILSRLKRLEESEQNRKEEKKYTLHIWFSVIAILISIISILLK